MATREAAGATIVGAAAEVGTPPQLHLVEMAEAEVAVVAHSNNVSSKLETT